MNKYPFLPKTKEEAAQRFANRTTELFQVILTPESKHNYPNWVRKIASSLQSQILPPRAIKALAERDECFISGFIGGMTIALQHIMQNSSPNASAFSLLVGQKSLENLNQPIQGPVSEVIATGTILQSPELRQMTLAMIDELATLPTERRTIFFEGLQAGSDIESLVLDGAFRASIAHDTQIIMLLFWPELDGMKTRREAYDFIQHMFTDAPSSKRSEEAFIRFAKDYGFKSKKAVKGGP
jgi:hypothetical protein